MNACGRKFEEPKAQNEKSKFENELVKGESVTASVDLVVATKGKSVSIGDKSRAVLSEIILDEASTAVLKDLLKFELGDLDLGAQH